MKEEFPDDMSDQLKRQLEADMFVFGCAHYKRTTDGYERMDPTKEVGYES